MKALFFSSILFCFSIVVLCETTPLDKELKEDGVTNIEVELKKADLKMKSGLDSELIDGTYHYNVFVPKGYNTNKEKRYFSIFIASPGGNAGLGNVQKWAKEKEWIVIMLVESKNGPRMPSLSNFIAAHDDAISRLRIQEGFKFATGFSGGARVSSHFPYLRPGFSGIILQGAGFGYGGKGSGYESVKNNKDVTVYAIIGKQDSNNTEIGHMKKGLPKHTVCKFVEPDMGHSWAKEEDMKSALEWSSEAGLKTTKMTKENESFILGFRERQWLENKDANNDISKLMNLEDLDRFLKMNRVEILGAEEKIKSLVSDLISELKKDPLMIKENNALRAYSGVEQNENMIRERIKDKQHLAPKMKTVYMQYASIAAKYEGTEYGKKAKDTAESIKAEFFESTEK